MSLDRPQRDATSADLARHVEAPGLGSMDDAQATTRLRLRRFTAADAPFALELHANPDLARFVPSAVLHTREDAEDWLRRIHGNAGPDRGWWLVELHDGTPVAAILLKTIPASDGHDERDIEIGWRQHAAHAGHGYVTEAAALVLRRGLARVADRIIAVTDPENIASQRVCERLGMTCLGTTRAYYDQLLTLFEARAQDAGR